MWDFSYCATAPIICRTRMRVGSVAIRTGSATLTSSKPCFRRSALAMELLDHSQIAVTMNTYSHVIPAPRRDAAEKMTPAYGPPTVRLLPALLPRVPQAR